MSEPITLYKNGETMTVTAPSFAKELIAKEGWRPMPHGQGGGIWANKVEPEVEPDDDDVPFDFAPVEDEPEPSPKPRRGRKPKAQK